MHSSRTTTSPSADRLASVTIVPYEPSMLDDIVRLSLRAWEPVFASLESVMEPAVFRDMFPDWREVQAEAVAAACRDDTMRTWVALEDGAVAGFAASRLHRDDRLGEVYMIAVDPEFQRRGIASALTDKSVEWFKDEGMSIAMVETGGDPGHAPARAAYESAGFRILPIARYFKKL